MTSKPPLPLSQQVLAWLLQAMGLLDDVSISRSTAKSALRGDMVWRSWDHLVADLLGVLVEDPPADEVERFCHALREADERASRLHDLGLPIEDRLPAVIRLLLPEVGCRLGALAALIDGGLASEALRHAPELADWVLDPLSPKVFGRVVEFLLLQHRPDLNTWEKRYDALDPPTRRPTGTKKVVSRSSVEGWRRLGARVPSVSNVVALAEFMGTGETGRRAELLLRVGRALTAAQQDLASRLGDERANEVAKALANWARRSREALKDPEFLAGMAEGWADVLEGAHGAAAVQALASLHGEFETEADPSDIAARLRAGALAARRDDDCTPLRLFQIQALFGGNRVLTAHIATQIGEESWTPDHDPYERLQAEWTFLALIKAAALGELPTLTNATSEDRTNRNLPEDLQTLAAALLDDARAVVRSNAAAASREADTLRFMVGMLTAMRADISHLPRYWSHGAQVASLSPMSEAILADDVVRAYPHLAVQRAWRLMKSGAEREALAWHQHWARSDGPKPWQERRLAGEVLIQSAHRTLDRAAKLRGDLRAMFDEELDDEAHLEQAEQVGQKGLAVLERMAEIGRKGFTLADAWLTAAPTSLEAPERVLLLLPLALRLDGLLFDLGTADEIQLIHTQPLVDAAQALLETRPTHGGLWASQAAYQAFVGEDSAFAAKHAEHFGAGAVLAEMLETLERDGWIDLR